MPHKVEISDKTFEKLKEYCSLNDLKIGQYADKLIYDGLMIEMYGDVPFTDYKKVRPIPATEIVEPQPMSPPSGLSRVLIMDVKSNEQEPIPEEVQKVIDEHFWEMLSDDKKEEKSTKEEALKQAGVPDKVVKKITKRRLK